MNLNRLQGLMAAPLAALFLVLILCTFVLPRPTSTGFRVPMIRLHHDPQEPYDCGGRSEFIRLTQDGKTWINDKEVPSDRLRSDVAELMENRAVRVVYVAVDSDLSYGKAAWLLDKVEESATELRVVLISGEIRRGLGKNWDLCDFVYPPKTFQQPSPEAVSAQHGH